MRRTVKATIGVGAAAGAMALAGSSALAWTTSPSGTVTSGTEDPDDTGQVSAASAPAQPTDEDQVFENDEGSQAFTVTFVDDENQAQPAENQTQPAEMAKASDRDDHAKMARPREESREHSESRESGR